MLFDCLSKVADPRRRQGRRYQLEYILMFSVLAMLCGATSYRKIQRFMNAHRERLNAWFGLAWKRAPAHTSIRAILQALDAQELEQAFRVHSQRLLDSRADADAPPAVAVDGKVLRGSFDRFQDQKAAQILSAFCQSEHLILGHLPVSTKTNEIPVAQQLIEQLKLEGCLYTFDALHCQKKTVDIAVEQGSAVIAQVKDNQPALLAAVQQVEGNDQPFERVCQVEQARNRIERREVRVFDAAPVLADLPESSGWPERLAAVIRVHRDTDCFDTGLGDWKRRTETAYYVATHRYSAEVFANAIRGHWGVENRNHHVRDVTLREDASRIRRNPGIFARLRSFTLNILRKNRITNVSEALYDNALCLDNLLDYEGIFQN